MLQAASNEADTYLRARYTLPLVADVGLVEKVAVSGSTGTATLSAAITSGYTLTQAYGMRLEVLTTGGSGVATARVSTDGGITWGATFTITSGTLAHSLGVTFTFSSGTWYDGDLFYVPISYGALTSHVVNIASWKLLTRRGVDPDSAAYDSIRAAWKEALRWLEGVRDNKVDPGVTDSTTGTTEGGFLFEPDDFEDGEGLRNWESVMGRQGRSTAESVSTTEDW